MLYTVIPGDTLYGIAEAHGSTAQELAAINQLERPSQLPAGMALVIPDDTPIISRDIVVNGYALTGIGDASLEGALPYLTYLSVFAARAGEDGDILPMNDAVLIRRAYLAGVAPLMTLTNQREEGGFSSDIARAVITPGPARAALIANIMEYLDQRNYYGINVDFEYIYPEDREYYTSFLTELRDRLKRVGYLLSVAVAPKTGPEQQGLLYTAHDYPAIGRVADYVMLMTYEWGYTYGEPMAVAPIGPVERVVQYAAGVIPPEKLLLGMANYGYDWTLPYRQGTAARAITLAGADDLAWASRADIRYDEDAASPYFSYYDSNGREHIAWFEDPRSIAEKFALVERYGLGGVSYWNLNSLYRPNWALLRDTFGVEKVRF